MNERISWLPEALAAEDDEQELPEHCLDDDGEPPIVLDD
jgi:hypothetical protein